jgi:hypothetical protein
MADRCEGVIDLKVLTLVTLLLRCILLAGIGEEGTRSNWFAEKIEREAHNLV